MQRIYTSKKIMLAASAGGHLTQLLRIRSAWHRYDGCVYVSSVKTVRKSLETHGKTYIIGECNRERPFRTIQVMWRSLRVVLKEKPNVVISTGAAPGMLCCLWAKILLRSKVIWIDSIANTNDLSLSGRLIRPFTDLMITQWPDVAAKYHDTIYKGNII